MTETSSSRRAALTDIRLREDVERARPIAKQGVHAGLWLDKYITDLLRDNTQNYKAELVAGVASLTVPAIYQKYYNRWKSYLDQIGVKPREFVVKGRMAVGLGGEGVLETSIALHRTYGVPYIPGSALKGLAASYARLMAGPAWEKQSEAYRVVFGDTDNAGFLTFFDALYIPGSAQPERRPATAREQSAVPANNDRPLHVDVITVHHPEYYKGPNAQGKVAPPADWDSPNPVPFLSATGSYLVALAAPDLANGDSWITNVFEILEEALHIMGIGAKTSSGYGRMKPK